MSDRIAMIFDVETTGLFKSGITYPHIIQLSYLLYNVDSKQLLMTYNTYVKPSQPVVLEEFITRLTGITQKDIETGTPIKQALYDFFLVLETVDILVAHNIKFDKNMIALEIARVYKGIHIFNGIQYSFLEMANSFGESALPNIWNLFIANRIKMGDHIEEFCTLKNSIELCNILRTNKNGKSYIKFPKLSETYEHLFGNIPEGLHDSLIDTVVCLRCFMKLYAKQDIGEIVV
jgi:DNA polymerase-3 subunit epsilon